MASDVPPESQTRDVTPSREEVRRALFQAQEELHVAPGMMNQVLRNGALTRKTIDGRDVLTVYNSAEYVEDDRSNTPRGSLIIHPGQEDPSPGTCSGYIHPPYGFSTEYRAEYGHQYCPRVTLKELAVSAEKCGFCSILYQGIHKKAYVWAGSWASHRWIDSHPDIADFEALLEDRPWVEEYRQEFADSKQVDETAILISIGFTRGNKYVSVHLMVGPWPRDKTPRPRNRPIGDLEFYTPPGGNSPWAAFGTAPHVARYVFGDECVGKMLDWVQDCHENHALCNSRVSTGLPSRLLHVALRDTGGGTSLLMTQLEDTDPTRSYRYASLSHVWANSTPLRTTRENIDRHRDHVPPQELSEVLIQTIYLAYHLGISYLWIDSLCIVQDDREDWEREFPRMGMIYGNAYVTFAAHGPDLYINKTAPEPLHDPFHPRDPPVYCREEISHAYMFSKPSSTASWFGRAWCMQERLFSPRILHFWAAEEEIVFECSTHARCECSRIPSDKSSLKARAARALVRARDAGDEAKLQDDLWQLYVDASQDYTARGITIADDTLPAVASFARELAPYLGRCYAGLWEHNFLLSLQWEAHDTCKSRRHGTYVAPSWSWASRSGPVIWYLGTATTPNPATHDFAELLEVVCVTSGKDPFGAVSGGHVKLRGYCTEMKIKDKTKHYPDDRLEMVGGGGVESCYVTLDTIEELDEMQEGQSIVCLDVMRDREGSGQYVSGLALLPVEGREGAYRRIGFSTMLAAHFVGSPLKEVVIV